MELETPKILSRSILVVDDSATSQNFIRKMLTGAGYTELHFEDNGIAALDYLGIGERDEPRKDIDLIILDIIMPGLSGLKVLRLVKSTPEYRDTPVIVISSDDSEDLLLEAFESGATDYIHKPPKKIELMARAHAAMKLKDALDERRIREKELEEANRLLQLANRSYIKTNTLDGLTGILNRKTFDQIAEEEWESARERKSPLSILMIDIDNFKAYNDNHGHQAGDDVLQRVAKTLAQSLPRKEDTLARYGGEEFIAVLPESDFTFATDTSKKMRKAVEDLNIKNEHSKSSGVITISQGIFHGVPSEHITLEKAVRLADKALYKAKADGKNTLRAYHYKSE